MEESQTDTSLLKRFARPYLSYVWTAVIALILVNGLEILLPIILARVVDGLVAGENIDSLKIWAVAYVGIAVVQAAGRFVWRYTLGVSGAYMAGDVRNALTRKLLRASTSLLDRKRSGDLVTLATNDSEAMSRLFAEGIVIIVDAVLLSIAVPLVMCWYSPALAALCLAPLVVVPWLMYRNDKRVHGYYRSIQKALEALTSSAQESFINVRTLKTFGAERLASQQFEGRSATYVEESQKLLKVESVFGPFLEGLSSLSLVILYIAGGWLAISGALSIGIFLAFQRYIQMLGWPMRAIALSVIVVRKSRTSAARISEIFTEPQEGGGTTDGEALPAADRLAVAFSNVSFSYPGSSQFVLDAATLEVAPGEKVAIVGEVGSGKSTLLALIGRLYDPTSGEVRVEGRPVQDWELSSLRNRIGYVPQEPFLFQVSVLENLAYGPHHDELDTRLAAEAVEAAAIREEVEHLPGAFESIVGERGVTLSGGQKQRLSIARALLARPSLLLLDNALSAVDSDTEEKILTSLRSFSGTLIVATQRMSTLNAVDRVVVLREGRIHEDGTLDSLLAKKDSWFYGFYEAQRFEEMHAKRE